MYLGIEIGGTKLQLAVGRAGEPLVDLHRLAVEPQRGATGILEQIDAVAPALIQQHGVERIGIGFGGPVHASNGVVIKSHHVAGWNDFPLGQWCHDHLERPAVVGNDCDVAALAESQCGAGRGFGSVFYVTVGSGIGGGFVCDGRLFGTQRPAAAEIGHLRPGTHADRPDATVESLASGWGIAAAARARLAGDVTHPLDSRLLQDLPRDPASLRQRLADAEQADEEFLEDLHSRCQGDPEALTAQMVAQAADQGNELAHEILRHACQSLGWAIAQVITLLAPEVVVVGGGVSLMGEQLFLEPVRKWAATYVFPPLADSYQIKAAQLGEEVVVRGAVALAESSY